MKVVEEFFALEFFLICAEDFIPDACVEVSWFEIKLRATICDVNSDLKIDVQWKKIYVKTKKFSWHYCGIFVKS